MQQMGIDRRDFCLGGCAGLGTLSSPVLNSTLDAGAPQPRSLYAAARKDVAGSFSAVLFSSKGPHRSVPLPGRGHDVAVRPHSDEVVVFARRPGRFAVVFSRQKSQTPFTFFARPQRHFYGHGVFSPDGRLLFTTENDYDNGVGMIGVWDATNRYQWIGEFSSHGVGPHDLALLTDGSSLVVANGGIETHPSSGRSILNRAEMAPSLVYIDCRTGDLLEKCPLPKTLHQLSIRHLTVADKDRVVFGCQFKGPADQKPPLMGMHDRGGELKFMALPANIHHQFKNYIGSVCADQSGEIVAASAPRGNLVGFWRVRDGQFLNKKTIPDGCGLARGDGPEDFLITSGQGTVVVGGKETSFAKTAFDNHAVRVSPPPSGFFKR